MITDKDVTAMRSCASGDRPYRTYVELSLSDLVEGTESTFLDRVSFTATGSLLYQNIDWSIVDFTKDTVILAVSGDVKEVIKELNEFQIQY